jgi:choline dehydrogenase
VTADYNGERQEGFGAFDARSGRGGAGRRRMPTCAPRWPVGNCTVLRGLVDRIEITEGRASGVRLSDGRF